MLLRRAVNVHLDGASMGMPNPMACAAPCAWPMPVAAYVGDVGMRLHEASERGDRRRAVSSRCGTWAPGPVCVWIAADADGSGSARRQDQSSKLETTRLRERGKRNWENADSIRHGGIEIKHSMRHTSHVMRISTFNRTFVKSSNRS